MKYQRLLSVILTWTAMAASSRAAASAAAAGSDWPFGERPPNVKVVDAADDVALFNAQTGIRIRKSDATVVGLWSAAGGNRVNNDRPLVGMKPALWTAEIMPSGTGQLLQVRAGAIRACDVADAGAHGQQLTLHFAPVPAGDATLEVDAHLRLDAPDSLIRWTLDARLRGGTAGLWSVTYPQLAVTASDAGTNANRLLLPYRQGTLGYYGPGAPRGDPQQPYPGPAAKFQFVAAYGEQSQQGFYYAAEDGAGYSKVFFEKNYPAPGCVLLAVQHLPAGRGALVREYTLPYAIATGPYQGDWWDAAQIYRRWWLGQVWAGKGPVRARADIPTWLKQSPVALRLSTSVAARTVTNNVAGALALRAALDHAPFFGIWYAPYDLGRRNETGLDASGNGHMLPPLPGVTDALALLRQNDIHVQSYIQSVIYQTNMPTPLPAAEQAAADAAVSRTRAGQACFYAGNAAQGNYGMCRATAWWQDRLVAMTEHATQLGFCGVYLDSFGKGADECFAPNHGHPAGGGNYIVQGQRRLAERVRAAARRTAPDAIFSGEAPIEAFADLLDVNLLAVNLYANEVPVIRTVWGDYQLQYGRTIRSAEGGDTSNIIPELTRLFLDGSIFGRFFCDGGKIPLLEPGAETQKAYLLKLVAYTRHGLDWLRFGAALRPLRLAPEPPAFVFRDSTKGKPATVPAVMTSVTRSAVDGSVALVLANVSDQPCRVAVPVDPAVRGPAAAAHPEAQLQRMDEAGACRPVRSGKKPWNETVEIAPRDVAFFILR